MKKQYVNELKAGETVSDIFVLAEKAVAQKRDGENFLNLTICDKSGRIKGVVWDNVSDINGLVASGDIVFVEGTVNEYKGVLQIVVKSMNPYSVESINPADFVPSTHRNIEVMFERLVDLASSFEADHLKALFQAFWEDEVFVRSFKTAPAAKKVHHAYIGGLLEHTLSMVSLADKIAKHYSGVDRDMLLAGTILHDIGKTREFEYTYRIDYSDEGRLLNHIVIGVQMLEEKLKTIAGFPEERAVLLKHMIVSHHGSKEFGSPEPPKTVEAVLLNYVDEIDSKINGIREFISQEDSKEMWTPYHRLWERHFYRGKGIDGEMTRAHMQARDKD